MPTGSALVVMEVATSGQVLRKKKSHCRWECSLACRSTKARAFVASLTYGATMRTRARMRSKAECETSHLPTRSKSETKISCASSTSR